MSAFASRLLMRATNRNQEGKIILPKVLNQRAVGWPVSEGLKIRQQVSLFPTAKNLKQVTKKDRTGPVLRRKVNAHYSSNNQFESYDNAARNRHKTLRRSA